MWVPQSIAAFTFASLISAVDADVGTAHLTLYEHGVSQPTIPCAHNKTLYLIRHAEGHHNADELAAEREGLHLKSARHAALREEHGIPWVLLEQVSGRKYHDPLLTPLGREQAYRLRHALRDDPSFGVDVVAFSPMRRTIETALLSIPQLEAVATTFTLDPPPTSAPPRLVASDLLRERVGPFMCDSRLTRSELADEYSHLGLNASIDLSAVSELDEMFASGVERSEPETGSARLAARAAAALRWLGALPEARVAVVAHKHILGALTGMFPDTVAQASFGNAERRTTLLCETPADQDPTEATVGISAAEARQEAAGLPILQPVRARVQPLGRAEGKRE